MKRHFTTDDVLALIAFHDGTVDDATGARVRATQSGQVVIVELSIDDADGATTPVREQFRVSAQPSGEHQ